MRMNRRKRLELQMKRILIIGVVLGAVAGILVTSFIGSIFRHREEKKQEAAKVVAEQQKKKEKKVEEKAVDAETIAKKNAEVLAAGKKDWQLTLVNRFYPLAKDYAPELVEAQEGKLVDKRIAEDLQTMLDDARKEGLKPFICSAYRDYEYQRQVFNETMVAWIADGYTPLASYEETSKSVAIPGTSEHATGLALDITSAEFAELDDRQADTPEAKWLAENCWKYGFVLRYPLDKSDVTGIVFEPWHYRYVGKEYAKEMTEKGLTLEEFVGKK